ncbi:hypothetical protein SPHINGO8BC_60001 [Sphingobacterium multivorum]|uniref:Uncharacterized protein n=1 Tax=Sphingobacterium multivorum TaxID=28454 RepID=A0A654DLK6_SPHMU|nr:hypothetical protein SPHINGO8BC_60001 [Sphingobacterium multivorum]
MINAAVNPETRKDENWKITSPNALLSPKHCTEFPHASVPIAPS